MRVRVDKVTKTYRARGRELAALEDISLDIEENEFLTILGPSGCGKSTLLLIIGRIESLTGGSIKFEGGRHSDGPLTTMVWQKYALFPWRTVLHNIAFGCEVRGMAKTERIERA